MVFLNEPDDVTWLKQVHGAPPETLSALVIGNEDCPERVDCFDVADPDFGREPFRVLYPQKELQDEAARKL